MSGRKIGVRTVAVALVVFCFIFAALGAYVLFLIFHTTPAYTRVDGSAAGMHVQLRVPKEGEGKEFALLPGSNLTIFGVKNLHVPNSDVTVFGVRKWAELDQDGDRVNPDDTIRTQRISLAAIDPDRSAIRVLACNGEPHMCLVLIPPCETRIHVYPGGLGEEPLTYGDLKLIEELSGGPALPKGDGGRSNVVQIRIRSHANTMKSYSIDLAPTSLNIAAEECHVTVDGKVLPKDSRLTAEALNLTQVTGPSKEAHEAYVAAEVAPLQHPWGIYIFTVLASRVEVFIPDASGALGDKRIETKNGNFDIVGELKVSFSGGPADVKTELSIEGTASRFEINDQKQMQSDWDNLSPGRRDLLKWLLAPNGILIGVLSVLYRQRRGRQEDR